MKGIRALIGPRPDCLGDSLAVELSALTRAALVRIQVPQPSSETRRFPPFFGWLMAKLCAGIMGILKPQITCWTPANVESSHATHFLAKHV